MEVSVSDCNLVTVAPASVTTTAAPIMTTQANKTHNVIRLQADPNNTATVYIGDSSVTTANGIALTSTTPPYDWYVRTGTKLYAVAGSGTQALRIAVM